jgi:hypothetical protein
MPLYDFELSSGAHSQPSSIDHIRTSESEDLGEPDIVQLAARESFHIGTRDWKKGFQTAS